MQQLILAEDVYDQLAFGKRCTIRKGKREIAKGDLEFKSLTKGRTIIVNVIEVYTCELNTIFMSHVINDGFKDYEDMHECMKRFYPDIAIDSEVTVIRFQLAEDILYEDYVTYQQALELKKLGFEEPCYRYKDNIGDYFDEKGLFNWNMGNANNFVSIPLKYQVFKWFRKKYQLHSHVTHWCGERFYYHIEDMCWPRRYDQLPSSDMKLFNESPIHEEAESFIVDKLIELAKINLAVPKP